MRYLFRNRRIAFEVCLILISGIFVSALLIKSNMSGKLFKVTMLGLVCFTVFLIAPYKEKILLCLSAFLLPFKIDINILYESTYYTRPINGFLFSAFDIPFFLLMLLWLYRLSSDYTLKIKIFPNVTIPFFFIWVLSLAGQYPLDVSMHIKISVLWLMFKSWLILIYLANNVDQQETIYLLVAVLLFSGLLEGLLGIAQYLNNGPVGLKFLGEGGDELQINQAGNVRVGGTIGHANKFALYLGTLLQLNVACLLSRFPDKYFYIRWMFFFPFFPIFAALLLTSSRGGWSSFLAGGVVNAYWCLVLKTGKKVFSAILVFAFFVFLAVSVFALVPSVRNRLLMDDGGSAEIRKPTAEIAHNIIYHNPFVGVGLNNYQSVIRKYDNTHVGASYHFPAAVHNEFLLIAAEIGLPSLFLFLYVVIWTSWAMWRVSQTKTDPIIPFLAIGFFCGFISWSMHNQKEYQYVFFTTRFWYHIGIMLAMKSFVEKGNENK